MKYLIPPSEGKAKIKPQEIVFANTNFRFSQHVNQVIRLLSLIDDEDLRSVYGTKSEKALKINPDDAKSQYQLALTYLQLNKVREARKKLNILYMLDMNMYDSLNYHINNI